jgi:hypothetical protein
MQAADSVDLKFALALRVVLEVRGQHPQRAAIGGDYGFHQLNSTLLSGTNAARANFPFLDVHPDQQSLFNTNARKDQTFDHIAFFIHKHETGLPTTDANQTAGQNGLNEYDYGVFDFVELFSQAVHGVSFLSLTASQRNDLLSRTKADVSHPMPIWVRLLIPGA